MSAERKYEPGEPMGVEEDGDDCFVNTDHCTKWGCEKAPLVKRGRFWCCLNCGASYGERSR